MAATPFPRSSDFTIGPELLAASKFVRVLEMVVGPAATPAQPQEDPRYLAGGSAMLISGGRTRWWKPSSNAGVKWQNNLANVCAENGDNTARRKERGGYLQHEEEREREADERRSLNNRLWAAPLKVVEIRAEPRKEERREGEREREDERPATDGRTDGLDYGAVVGVVAPLF